MKPSAQHTLSPSPVHDGDQLLARRFRALGHPVRIAILRALASRKACVCGELVAIGGLAQSTVSEHLRVLREAGLVSGRSEGTRSCYCLDEAGMRALAGEAVALLDALGDSGAPS